ncbi:MAG TPA: ComEC/Rec2 family competence protein, partial [Coleofasciculaceae cyanobacterium]
MGVASQNQQVNGSISVIFCLAILLGLFSTAVPWGCWGLAGFTLGIALLLPRYWRRGPKPLVWLLAGVIGLLASGYFYLRIPQPAATDISQFLPPVGQQTVVVGTVQSRPYLTRSGKVQFWLAADQLGDAVQGLQRTANQSVTGKLYVTLPPQTVNHLQPGQSLGIVGTLYHPSAATNPNSFDFKDYLAQSGSFAGLRGCRIFDAQAFVAQGGDLSSIRDCEAPNLPVVQPESHLGWWTIQERIARSQARWLEQSEAALVTAMVLGSKAVDLPFEVKDAFLQVGLAAALAASGFQISLILGVVLSLTRRCAAWMQAIAGGLSLILFVGLAGGQPSVLRAAVMGAAGLVGILVQRKVRPLGTLLLATVGLLIWNPLWVYDLGFELSVLATLGLLVTAPTLTKWLDWLPPAIAALIAVPSAAYLWTLPVQLAAFGVLSPYSIPANILTTPFISVISIGGMVSALASVIWAPAGSALAYLLHFPTRALITIVKGFSQLPGSTYASGSVSPLILVTLYGLIGLTWLTTWWRQRWWLPLFLGVVLTLVPLWQRQATATEATILATQREPIMIIRDRGKTVLLNSGDAAMARYTLLPLLQKAGVNE